MTIEIRMDGWQRVHVTPWIQRQYEDAYRAQIVAIRERDKVAFALNLISPAIVCQSEVEKRGLKRLASYTSCGCHVEHKCTYHEETEDGRPIGLSDEAEEEDER